MVMKKVSAVIIFFIPVVFVRACEAMGAAERFALQNPGSIRMLLLGIVLAVGAAIVVIRVLFNKAVVEKSAEGLGGVNGRTGSVPSEKPLKLRSAKLIEIHENRSYSIPVDGSLTIGRLFDNMVVIKNPSVSRYHAKIAPEPEGYVLYDLGSKKGTFVNGEMTNRKILRNSDMIEIAREDFMFVYE